MYKFTNATVIKGLSNGALISDGFIALRLKCEGLNCDSAVDQVESPDDLFNRLSLATDERSQVTKSLLAAGLLQLAEQGPMLEASYVSQRLKAFYVRKSQQVWKANPALVALKSSTGNPNLAKGFLVETYHHVKGAKWTSVPVLSHSLSPEQRKLFENFYIGERNHYAIFERALTHLGLRLEDIQACLPNTETELLERHFHSIASSCPLEFAAALIAPEVDGLSEHTSRKVEILDQLVAYHGIPEVCAKAFRLHDHDHEADDHDSLPLQIISSYGQIPVAKVRRLFEVLHHTIEAYDVMFRGVALAYSKDFELRLGRYSEWM